MINRKFSSPATLTGFPAGIYDIEVYDNANCLIETVSEITITQPEALELSVDATQNPWGSDPVRNGFIEVSAQGGIGDYTFWQQPDSTSNNNGIFEYSLADTGTYIIYVIDSNECGPVSTDPIEINYGVGFETQSGIETKVYPNPTSGIITLEMPIDEPECDMEVINMTGQLVIKRKLYSSGGVITETLDLSDQAKGLYLIRIDGQALQSTIMVK